VKLYVISLARQKHIWIYRWAILNLLLR